MKLFQAVRPNPSNPANGHQDGVAGIAVHGFLNGFADSQNVADGAIGVFDTHVDDAAAVGNAIEGSFHLYPTLAEFLADVERNPDKSPPLSGTGSITASN